MKIALISHHFPPHYNAGAEQYAYRIARELQQRNHSVEIVCVESISEESLAPTCLTETYNGLLVHRLSFDVQQAPDVFEWSFRNPELGQWVQDYLQHTRPDLVHINSGYLLGGTVPEAAHALGIPTVLTLHDYWFACPQITLLRQDGSICREPVPPARCVWCSLSEKRRYRLPDQSLHGRLGDAFVGLTQSETAAELIGVAPKIEQMSARRAYLRQVLEKVDLAVSPSQFLIDKLAEYHLKPRRIYHVPLGLDEKHLSGVSRRDTPVDELRIGYLGQHAPHKGVHLLIEAFKRLDTSRRKCRLVLHGKAPDTSPYGRELLRRANHHPGILFAGPYPNSQVGRVLNDLDVLVVPSIWYENMPAVIAEALATQAPVVASRIGGIPELVRHNENGLLFEAGSVAGLAEQLQRLLDEPALVSHLRNTYLIPTIGEEVATLLSLYKSLLPASTLA